jgi:hypothetical protein
VTGRFEKECIIHTNRMSLSITVNNDLSTPTLYVSEEMIAPLDNGGRGVKKTTSSAQLHAEKLFEAKPIADIREVNLSLLQILRTIFHRRSNLQIEKRTRSDIDSKKQQLRQLVGGSYKYFSKLCWGIVLV